MNLSELGYNVAGIPVWALIAYLAIVGYASFLSVKFYLHHHVTHRIIALNPVMKSFLRTWLWLTTGTVVRSWATIHRKHHYLTSPPRAEPKAAPEGIMAYLSMSTEYYRAGSMTETLARFGTDIPNDWWERHVFSRGWLGLGLLAVVDVYLFGALGIVVWAVQLLANPIMASAAAGPGLAGPPPQQG